MEVTKEFKAFFQQSVSWAVCGGDAIDLFIGRQTREHKDLDVAVFWENRDKIINYMLGKGWRVFEPDNGKLREITSLNNDLKTNDNLWCLTKDNDSYTIKHITDDFYDIECNIKNQTTLDYVEFLFNNIEDDYFLYKRDFNIKLKMDKAINYSKDDIPYLAPEFVLLYKATFIRYLGTDEEHMQEVIANTRHDFDSASVMMSSEQLYWLKDALVKSYGNHEWIEKIEKRIG